MRIDPTKRYFKFLSDPNYFGDPKDQFGEAIRINQKGGEITDPKAEEFRTVGLGSTAGLYFTDVENCGYYYTYGDYYVEVFPDPNIAVKRCWDDDGRGYYTYKLRYSPVKEVTAKFACWLMENGADVTLNDCSMMHTALALVDQKPNNKWTRRAFQQMMIQLSQHSELRDEFDECWEGTARVLGGGVYIDLFEMLKDPRFDISMRGNGFGFIEEFKHQMKHPNPPQILDDCIHQFLLRLRIDHPAVYAITIGQFQKYEDELKTARSRDGFLNLLPVYNGPYDEYRTKKHRE